MNDERYCGIRHIYCSSGFSLTFHLYMIMVGDFMFGRLFCVDPAGWFTKFRYNLLAFGE
jgi:hypothetical protein